MSITLAVGQKTQKTEQTQFVALLDEAQFEAFATAVAEPGERNVALSDVIERSRNLLVDG